MAAAVSNARCCAARLLVVVLLVAVTVTCTGTSRSTATDNPFVEVSVRDPSSNDRFGSTSRLATFPRSAGGTFVSLAIDGTCRASIKYTHPLSDLLVIPHAWHRMSLAAERLVSAGVSLQLLESGGHVSMTAASNAAPEALRQPFLVVAQEESTTDPLSSLSPFRIAHMFPDPRYTDLHGFHGDNLGNISEPSEPVPPKVMFEATATEHLWFPGTVRRFDLYCQNTSSSSKLSFDLRAPTHPKQRPYAAQASTLSVGQDIEVINEFTAGPPSSQLNVIFLAGGFTADQKDIFLSNVTALRKLMMDPNLDPASEPDPSNALANMHRSVPFNRYWPFFNVYAVFQPSAQSGASRPKAGIIVDNNLKCQHPEHMERAVNCDRDLALALADTTPARPILRPDRCLIIALVNTPLYGGSGVFIPGKLHMGNFFNGYDMAELSQKERMLSLMDHEIGHAFGKLVDEYDIGVTENRDRALTNCQMGSSSGGPPSSVQWQQWIDIARADPTGWITAWGNGMIDVTTEGSKQQWGILSVPQVVCGYTNYYKPSENCMLHRLNNYFMCPVCREQSSLVMMKNNFSLSWPRKPLLDTTVLIPKDNNDTNVVNYNTAIILHLPIYLTSANSYIVTVKDADGSILPFDPKTECPVCVKLDNSNFAKYPVGTAVRITVTIEDNTVFISPGNRPTVANQLKQETYFSVMVVDSVSGYANVTLEPGSKDSAVGKHEVDNYARYVQCVAPADGSEPVCSMNFTSKTYEAPLDLNAAFDNIEYWVYGAIGGLAVLFLLLWLYAANRYKTRADGRPRLILKTQFSCCISFIRGIMMGSAVLFMLASLGVMGLACYYYTQVSALGKIIIFAGVGLAVGLYVMAFFGYWSVSSRSKKMLIVNGGVLFFGLAVLVAAGILVTNIGEDMKNEDGFWTTNLESLWRTTVEVYPDRACAIEGMLQCSGFNNSCTSVVGSSLDCPTNCEKTNEKYYIPCRNQLRSYINDNYDTIVQIVAGSASLLVVGLVFNFIYFCALVRIKRDIAAQHRKALARMRSAKKGKDLEDRHKALYILKSLGKSNTPELIREFRRMDKDGSGSLDKKEMFVFLKDCMYYRASIDEINCIFELADVDGNGVISLSEFLAIFGRSVPRELDQRGLEEPMKARSNSLAVRQRMRQQYASTALYDDEDDAEIEMECARSPIRAAQSPGAPIPRAAAHRQLIDDAL